MSRHGCPACTHWPQSSTPCRESLPPCPQPLRCSSPSASAGIATTHPLPTPPNGWSSISARRKKLTPSSSSPRHPTEPPLAKATASLCVFTSSFLRRARTMSAPSSPTTPVPISPTRTFFPWSSPQADAWRKRCASPPRGSTHQAAAVSARWEKSCCCKET